MKRTEEVKLKCGNRIPERPVTVYSGEVTLSTSGNGIDWVEDINSPLVSGTTYLKTGGLYIKLTPSSASYEVSEVDTLEVV